jgi:RNA-binding protein
MLLHPSLASSCSFHLLKSILLDLKKFSTLNSKAIAYLRSLAHTLNPVVRIGNKGLSASVIKEIELKATAVHHIGLQIIVYRQASEPKIVIPK